MPEIIAIPGPGTYLDSNGNPRPFTIADLRESAESYDPKLHAAPIVIGHPKDDAPAYGWLEHARVTDGGALAFDTDRVNPQFAEQHRAGSYRKHSLALYPPDDPRNPKPGVWYPRHLGFLGAQPPAIKGLPEVQFAEGDQHVSIEFGEVDPDGLVEVLRSIMSRLRDLITDKFGRDEADRTVPDWQIDSKSLKASISPEGETEFAEDGSAKGTAGDGTGGRARKAIKKLRDAGMSTDDISEALSDLPGDVSRSAGTLQSIASGDIANPPDSLVKALEAIKPKTETEFSEEDDETMTEEQDERARKLDEREARIAAQEAERRNAEAVAFAEAQADALRIHPRQAPRVAAILSALESAPEPEEIEFAEADDAGKPKQVKAPAAVAFREFVSGLTPIVKPGKKPDGDSVVPEDITAEEAARRARKLVNDAAAEGRTVGFAEAVNEVWRDAGGHA